MHHVAVTRLGLVLAPVLVGGLLAGCGDRPVPRWSDVNPPVSPDEVVLYDDEWVVEEGVWDLGEPGKEFADPGRAFRGQANGLLGARVPGTMVLAVPGLYGKYRTRVELHESRPPVPPWCQDVVEVPFRSHGELAMSSFESFEPPWEVPAGTYRVRSCVTGLDAAATEDEFDGDDYRTYTGRHLVQLWPSDPAPDAVVRVGSRWAAEQHRG